MKSITQSEQERYRRTAYVALDAVDRLVGHGLGGNETERALEAIRALINQIDAAELKQRGKKPANPPYQSASPCWSDCAEAPGADRG